MTRSARGNARGLWGVRNCDWGEGFRIEKVWVCSYLDLNRKLPGYNDIHFELMIISKIIHN